MKIVLCCRAYPTTREGGMSYVVQDRAEELAKKHEVFVLTAGERKEEVLNGVNIRYVGGKEVEYSKEFSEGCEEWCKKINADIVHLDSFSVHHPWWHGRKVGITLHGFGPGSFFTKWNQYKGGQLQQAPAWNIEGYEREITHMRRAEVVIGISSWEYNLLKDFYSLSNACKVYNPIAPYFFEGDLKREGQYFLCLEKNLTAGRNFGELESAFKELDLPIRIVRGKSRKVIPGYLDSAIALILPTYYAQGYDLTVAEAHAREVPVIATHTGSYALESELIDGLHTFSLKNWEEAASLANIIKGFKERPCREFSEVVERHHPKNHVKNWLAVMRDY